MKKCWITYLLMVLYGTSFAQKDTTIFPFKKHDIQSEYLDDSREYWVSLPLGYSDTNSYPVIYVFDAEWRFDIIRNISWYLGAEKKINNSIIVGIPHVEIENQRGKDLTFSHSRIEYDGEEVDSTWWNSKNSGNGNNFYQYITQELMSQVNKNYATNGFETLIGHSLGGYFGLYILSRDHPFEVIHAYDPSVWYSGGEVIEMLQQKSVFNKVKLFVSYQSNPPFHKDKIVEFIELGGKNENIELHQKYYPNESHNGLFMDSFITGIQLTNQP